ncbi:hypothetical protein [Brumicola pallidula]|jgi:hypothetical protein|uniref:Uncharacterized protein n=1 Tax=Brumicola pallidula DSM 14239 = ACAM 615 TaxID=1121922 RepID=K6Y856_9ALTE|nr:hypothetical protein [Glaciecola pallidula]GAC28944.1 hypothetical protein GPAL_2083 [Glaciecola pallidula DSM 14239 = ACAM 615]
MLKIFLSLVSIFAANAAFYSDDTAQFDKNTSVISCSADSEIVGIEDIDDVETDIIPLLYALTIARYVNVNIRLGDVLTILSSSALFPIRAPPHHY